MNKRIIKKLLSNERVIVCRGDEKPYKATLTCWELDHYLSKESTKLVVRDGVLFLITYNADEEMMVNFMFEEKDLATLGLDKIDLANA